MSSLLPALPNGTFTASHPKFGSFTVKLHTAKSGQHAGRRIFSLQIGPVTKPVAYWHEEHEWAELWPGYAGPNSQQPVTPWHYQRDQGWSACEQKLAIALDLALRGAGSHWRASGYRIVEERRCVACNALLAVPATTRCTACP